MNDNIEYALLGRIIQDGDFRSADKARITEEYFQVPEVREVYRFLKGTYHSAETSGLVPSAAMVKSRFPQFYLTLPPDPVPVLCAELRRQKLRTDLQILARELSVEADRDPAEALALLRGETPRITGLSESGEDLSMAGAYGALYEQYQMVENGGGLTGIPYPWDPLNEVTQGMHPGEFLVIYGRPKCVPVGELIPTAEGKMPIAQAKSVLGWDPGKGGLSHRPVLERTPVVQSRVATLVTKSGRARVGTDHPVLKKSPNVRAPYFVKAEMLQPGMLVGVARGEAPAPEEGVIWEPLTDVHLSDATEPCIDILVGGHHNFVVGGLVTHNSMKSWLAVWMARCAYMQGRRRVLFYTREMHPLMIARRVAAAQALVDYDAFRKGRLQPELKEKIFRILLELQDDERAAGVSGHQPCFIITTDRSRNTDGSNGGISWLRAKIDEVRPDIVFVDGMYLMYDDRSKERTVDWKAIGNISGDLKSTAQDFNIPVVGVTQANRKAEEKKGEDLTELAYSDKLGQDADAVYRVRRVVDKVTREAEIHLTIAGMREAGSLDGIVLAARPAFDFSFKRIIVHADEQEGGYRPDNGGKPGNGGEPQSTFRRGPIPDPKLPPRR